VAFTLAGVPTPVTGAWHWNPGGNGVYEPADDVAAAAKSYPTNGVYPEPAIFVPTDARMQVLATTATVTVYEPRTDIITRPYIASVSYGDVLGDALILDGGVVKAADASGDAVEDISDKGFWSWKNPGATLNSTTGKQTVVLVFTPTDEVDWSISPPVGYLAAEIEVELTLAPRQVTVTGLGASDKTYDATDGATVSGTPVLVNALDADVAAGLVSLAPGEAHFVDENAGDDKQVSFSGFTLSGARAANYVLSEQPVSVTASIARKQLTIVSTTVLNKVYDGTTDATVSDAGMLEGVIDVDNALGSSALSLDTSAATAVFADANVGEDKTVSFSGFALVGTRADNYVLAADQPPDTMASITSATPVWEVAPQAEAIRFGQALSASALSGVARGVDGLPLVGALVWDAGSGGIIPGSVGHEADGEGNRAEDGIWHGVVRFVPDVSYGQNYTEITAPVTLFIVASAEVEDELESLVDQASSELLVDGAAQENYDSAAFAAFRDAYVAARTALDAATNGVESLSEHEAERLFAALDEALGALVHTHPVLFNSALSPVTGTGTDVRVEFKGDFVSVLEVLLDGQALVIGTGSSATQKTLLRGGTSVGELLKGSAVVVLHASFMDSLSNGTHTLEVRFADAHASGSGSAQFVIERPSNAPGGGSGGGGGTGGSGSGTDGSDSGSGGGSGSDNNGGSGGNGGNGGGGSGGNGSGGNGNNGSGGGTITPPTAPSDNLALILAIAGMCALVIAGLMIFFILRRSRSREEEGQ
jgi:hypothetical protein